MSRPTRLLRVQNDYFTAGAVWEKIGGFWSCTKPAPIIGWMRGKTPDAAKFELLRLGCSFEWLNTPISVAACNTAPSPQKDASEPTADPLSPGNRTPGSGRTSKACAPLATTADHQPTDSRCTHAAQTPNREPRPYPVTTQA